MREYYNWTPIPVTRLESDGFIVTGDSSAHIIRVDYKDGWIVASTTEKDGIICMGDIREAPGRNQTTVLAKLYELYDIGLMNEEEFNSFDIFQRKNPVPMDSEIQWATNVAFSNTRNKIFNPNFVPTEHIPVASLPNEILAAEHQPRHRDDMGYMDDNLEYLLRD